MSQIVLLLISKKQQFSCLIKITTQTHTKEICNLILPQIAIVGVVKRDVICLFLIVYIITLFNLA